MPDILYSDNHLLFLDKPGGLLTQPSGTERDSLESQAKEWIKRECGKPGNVFLEAVHRIDAPACGVVLFARTGKALSRLTAAVREGRCRKEYRLLVEGTPPSENGTLENWLCHDSRFTRVTPPHAPGARLATLSYTLLERRADGLSLIGVLLESGRYHQIRAQFAHIGCPVAGDSKYGSTHVWRRGAIALQHYRLTIEHPVTHESLTVTSRILLS